MGCSKQGYWGGWAVSLPVASIIVTVFVRAAMHPAALSASGIFGGEKRAGCRGGRSTGNDELVSGKARALVGLKHAIAERVLLGQSEIRLNIGRIDVHELRIWQGK